MRGLFLFVLLACACERRSEPPADFSRAGIEARIAAIRPHVEAVLGESLGGPVRFAVATPEELQELLTRQFVATRKGIEGAPGGDLLEQACRLLAELLSQAVYAYVDVFTGTLHICPENFARIAGLSNEWAGMTSQTGLDVVIAHELVHVWQMRRYPLLEFVGTPHSNDVLMARASVAEGHAQYVAERVARRMKLTRGFELMVSTMRDAPEDLRVGFNRDFVKKMQDAASTPYIHGQTFVEAAARRLGYKAAVARIFEQPPAGLEQVRSPKEYFDPTPPPFDHDRAVRIVRRYLAEQGDDEVTGEETLVAGRRAIWFWQAADAASARKYVETLASADPGHAPVRVAGFDGVHANEAVLLADGDLVFEISAEGRAQTERLALACVTLVSATRKRSPWTGRRGDDAIAPLVRGLADRDWSVRWRAARNLGRMLAKHPELDGPLRPMLDDAHPLVRVAAVRALREPRPADPDWQVRAESERLASRNARR